MNTPRIVVRGSPMACRAVRAAPAVTRGAHYYHPVNYHAPRFPSFNTGSEFGSLFRVLDDLTTSALRGFDSQAQRAATYQPRFDVAEHEGSYELKGDLPGIESSELDVEFSDNQTLVIKGQTEKSSSLGDKQSQITPAAEETAKTPAEVSADDWDNASVHSASSFVNATVEDDPEESSTRGQQTPAESTTSPAPVAETAADTPTQPKSTYWVSERRVGSFERRFKFPGRIDQDGVKASLKNGVLSIIVPKAAAPAARRIQIE